MKHFYLAVLTALAIVPAIAAADFGLTPPALKCIAPTVESIKVDMNRESLQRAYDAAEEIISKRLRRLGCDDEWAEAIAHAAVDNKILPVLMAGMVYYESSCNPKAVSNRKCFGLTQINPWAHPEIMEIWTMRELWNPYINAQAGAKILAVYIHRYGVKEGLHHYNGMGDQSDSYSTKVLHYAGLRA